MSNDTESNGRSGPEVSEKPVRRRFTAEYKLRIIEEAEGCTDKGQVGELLRRDTVPFLVVNAVSNYSPGMFTRSKSNVRLRIRMTRFVLVTAAVFALVSNSVAAVERVVETFDNGFDNIGWRVRGDGQAGDGGFKFVTEGGENEDWVGLERNLAGTGTFTSRAAFRDVNLGEFTAFSWPDSSGDIFFGYQLGPSSDDWFGMNLVEFPNGNSSTRRFAMHSGALGNSSVEVPQGSSDFVIALSLDVELSTVTFSYEDLINVGETFESTVEYPGIFETESILRFGFNASYDGKAIGILDYYELIPEIDITGDFNGSNVLDVEDIDLLSQQVRDETNDPLYDLNGDNLVNDADHTFWVKELKQAYFGDANFNGEFNSSDLVLVFGVGEYEDDLALNSTWAGGDWNGDGDFTSSDLVTAFQDGGYEQGPSPVPEPQSVLSLLALLLLRRKHPVK